MPAPTPYKRSFSFTNAQADSPADPLAGHRVDIELDAIAQASAELTDRVNAGLDLDINQEQLEIISDNIAKIVFAADNMDAIRDSEDNAAAAAASQVAAAAAEAAAAAGASAAQVAASDAEAAVVAADAAAAEAVVAATAAENAAKFIFADQAGLLADNRAFSAGDIILTRAEGYSYIVRPVGSLDHDLMTAGLVRLRVLPTGDVYHLGAFGAAEDGVTDDAARVARWLERLRDDPGKRGECKGYSLLGSEVVLSMTDHQHVSISGPGQNTGGFLVSNATGGIHFSGAARQHSVEMHDIHFKPGLAESGYPFKITGVEGGLNHNRSCILRNIFCGNLDESGAENFSNGISTTGIYRPYLSNVQVFQNAQAVSKWTHMHDVSGSYSPYWEGCYLNANYAVGSVYGILAHGDAPEGFTYIETIVSGCDYGCDIDNTAREPHVQFIGGHFNNRIRNIRASGVKFMTVTNILFYMVPDVGANNAIDIQIRDCHGADIHSNFYNSPTTEPRLNHINLNVAGDPSWEVRSTSITERQFLGLCSGAAVDVGGAVRDTVVRVPKDVPAGVLANYPAGLVSISSLSVNTKVIRDTRISSFFSGAVRDLVDFINPLAVDQSSMMLMFHDAGAGHVLVRVKRGAAGTGPGGVGKALYVD